MSDLPHALILMAAFFGSGSFPGMTAYPVMFNNEIDCKWAGVRWVEEAKEKSIYRPNFVCIPKWEMKR